MCTDCESRARMLRQDLLSAHIGGAAKHAVKGLAEMVGLSEKTGAAEEEAKIAADVDPPSKSVKGKSSGG